MVLARLVAALLRRRTLALLVLLGLVLVACGGLVRLRIDFSSAAFYGGERAMAERLAAHEAAWGIDDDLVLVLVYPESANERAGVLSRPRLEAIAELSRALERDEGVVEVTSLATLELPRPALLRPRAATDDPGSIDFIELSERLLLAELSPANRRVSLERLPVVPTLLSREGDTLAIVVELAFSSDDVQRTAAAVERLQASLDRQADALAGVGLRAELAGVPAIRAGFFELLIRDQLVFVPLTLGLIGLALLLVFRRLHGVLIPASAAALPTLMLVGLLGWIGEPVGLLNQAYFTLLPVIAVADAIHMVARFHEQLLHDEPILDVRVAALGRRDRAIAIATQRVGLACLLTSLTTAAGFASLLVADMPILRSFGLYAAIGVALAFVLMIVLVPLLLSFVPLEIAEASARARPFALGLVELCAKVTTRRPGLVLVVIVGLALAAIPLAARVEIDNKLTGLVDSDHPVRHASARIDENLGGSLGLELDLVAPAGVDLRDPALLERMLGFERWLAEREPVRSVEGLAGWIAAFGDLGGNGRTVPRERAQVDATLAELGRWVPLDRLWLQAEDGSQRTRIRAGLPDVGGKTFTAFADEAERELQRRLAGSGVEAYATGTPLLAYRGVNRITHDLRSSFAQLFVVIAVVLVLLFRRAVPALIALPPNFLPLWLGYAVLGFSDTVLDPLAAVILTLALGIAVDDTLHILVRVREQLGPGDHDRAERAKAVREALRGSGQAVVITSLVIAGGFALNLLSSFPPLATLGLLGSLVLLLALLADLLMLPALIVLFGRGLGRGGG